MPKRANIESHLAELKILLHRMADRVLAGLVILVNTLENQASIKVDTLIKLATADAEVDMLERTIDKAILELFATQQPLAFELRFAYSSAKIANYLERMGDAVESLARQIVNQPQISEIEKFQKMIRATQELYLRAYAAMFQDDLAQIYDIDLMDDKVDALYREVYLCAKEILLNAHSSRNSVEEALHLMNLSTQIEKFADLSCQWAKQVDFARNGTARTSISRTKYKVMFIDSGDGLLASAAASLLAEQVKELVHISVLSKNTHTQRSLSDISQFLADHDIAPNVFPITTLEKAQWQRTLLFIEIGNANLAPKDRDFIPFKTVRMSWLDSSDSDAKTNIDKIRSKIPDLAQLIGRSQPN